MVDVATGVEVICNNRTVYGFRFIVENCTDYGDTTEISGVNALGDVVMFYVSNDVVYNQDDNAYTNGEETVELLI